MKCEFNYVLILEMGVRLLYNFVFSPHEGISFLMVSNVSADRVRKCFIRHKKEERFPPSSPSWQDFRAPACYYSDQPQGRVTSDLL